MYIQEDLCLQYLPLHIGHDGLVGNDIGSQDATVAYCMPGLVLVPSLLALSLGVLSSAALGSD